MLLTYGSVIRSFGQVDIFDLIMISIVDLFQSAGSCPSPVPPVAAPLQTPTGHQEGPSKQHENTIKQACARQEKTCYFILRFAHTPDLIQAEIGTFMAAIATTTPHSLVPFLKILLFIYKVSCVSDHPESLKLPGFTTVQRKLILLSNQATTDSLSILSNGLSQRFAIYFFVYELQSEVLQFHVHQLDHAVVSGKHFAAFVLLLNNQLPQLLMALMGQVVTGCKLSIHDNLNGYYCLQRMIKFAIKYRRSPDIIYEVLLMLARFHRREDIKKLLCFEFYGNSINISQKKDWQDR